MEFKSRDRERLDRPPCRCQQLRRLNAERPFSDCSHEHRVFPQTAGGIRLPYQHWINSDDPHRRRDQLLDSLRLRGIPRIRDQQHRFLRHLVLDDDRWDGPFVALTNSLCCEVASSGRRIGCLRASASASAAQTASDGKHDVTTNSRVNKLMRCMAVSPDSIGDSGWTWRKSLLTLAVESPTFSLPSL